MGLLLAGGFVLTACGGLPTFEASPPADAQAKHTFSLWQGAVITALAVGAVVMALIVWNIVRYRHRSGDPELPDQRHGNGPLEVVYTAVPIVIVAVLFFFTVGTDNSVDAVSRGPAARVKVTAYQWGWQFHYQGTPVTVGTIGAGWLNTSPALPTSPRYPQLVLPEGEATQISLVSLDVVHGFYVHAFLFSRYAQPGVTNVFDLTPTKLGVFQGRCSQLCGLYHAEMLFSVKVVTPAQFRSWLAAQTHAAVQTQQAVK